MPKKYPVEVRLFAVQKKKEGHTWERVAEMVRQNFGLDSVPSRRQMTKWVANKMSVSDIVLDRVGRGLPNYTTQFLTGQQDAMTKIVTDAMSGKDFGILIMKWMLLQMKATFGGQRLKTAWAEFIDEEERIQQDSNVTNDKMGTPFTEEIVPEERSGQ